METQRSSSVKFWTLIVLFTVLGSATLGAYLMAAPANVNRFYGGGLSLATGGDGFSIGSDTVLSRSAANIWTLGAGDSLIGATWLNSTSASVSNLYANTALIDGYYPGNPCSYTIGVDGATYWARNETTGVITTGSNATTMIQSCIDGLDPNLGGRILLKAGAYQIDGKITIDEHNVQLFGEGAGYWNLGVTPPTGITLLNVTNVIVPVINIAKSGGGAIGGVVLSDFYLYGGNTASVGIEIAGGDKLKLNRVVISHFADTGLIMRTGEACELNNCFIAYCVNFGVLLDGVNLYEFVNTGFSDCTTYNLYIYGAAAKNKFVSCDFGNIVGTSVHLAAAATQNIFLGNSFHNNGVDVNDAVGTNIFIHNTGYVTENAVTGTIASGATSVVINHGLGYTPTAANTAFTITATELSTNDAGNFYVDTLTATQATVHCLRDPGASNLDFTISFQRVP